MLAVPVPVAKPRIRPLPPTNKLAVLLTFRLRPLSLLLEVDLPQAHKLAREVFEIEPTRIECVLAYAFSLHAKKRTKEAARLVHELKVEEVEKPGFAAYAGVILAAAGEEARAKELFSKASKGKLLIGERKLVEESLAKLSAPPEGARMVDGTR